MKTLKITVAIVALIMVIIVLLAWVRVITDRLREAQMSMLEYRELSEKNKELGDEYKESLDRYIIDYRLLREDYLHLFKEYEKCINGR